MFRELNIFFNRSKFFIKFQVGCPIIFTEGNKMKTKIQTQKQFNESRAGKALEKRIQKFFKKHGIKGKNMTPTKWAKLSEAQKNEYHFGV